MENEFDYYFIRNSFKGGTVPRLMVDDKVNPSGTSFLSLSIIVPETYVAHLCFGSPIPPKPSLDVDGLGLEGNCSVFSKKIYDAVNPHNFKGIQFVPTVIRGKNDEEFNDFYIANIYQEIASFDPEKSRFDEADEFDEFDEADELTDMWSSVRKIVLDRAVLSEMPLEDRLVFVAKEHPGFILYHKTIVDVMKSANPDGLIFTPVEEWYSGMQM